MTTLLLSMPVLFWERHIQSMEKKRKAHDLLGFPEVKFASTSAMASNDEPHENLTKSRGSGDPMHCLWTHPLKLNSAFFPLSLVAHLKLPHLGRNGFEFWNLRVSKTPFHDKHLWKMKISKQQQPSTPTISSRKVPFDFGREAAVVILWILTDCLAPSPTYLQLLTLDQETSLLRKYHISSMSFCKSVSCLQFSKAFEGWTTSIRALG